MKINRKRITKLLDNFQFQDLFIEELGWDYPEDENSIYIPIDEDNFSLIPIAQKRGFNVYQCFLEDQSIPLSSILKKIDREINKYAREHFIIYASTKDNKQVWQWVKREANQPLKSRTVNYSQRKKRALLDALENISFEIQEEEKLNLIEVKHRTKKAFDIEKVTKKFFEQFQREHRKFVEFIQGIDDLKDCSWYASVLLNRLMFVYFLQKKGFLDNGNTDYLQDKLKASQTQGKNLYYSQFLHNLFFEGFGKQEYKRSPETKQLIGRIKYLNGGLFLPHQIESKYQGKIKINDQAFADIFTLFSAYRWHLDDTPSGNENEINPDVLGYIFEKYINQKAFGAYYTKPEITNYLCDRTINKFIEGKLLKVPFSKGDLGGSIKGDWGDKILNNETCNLLLDNVLPNLSILDPACGSGAFLVAGLQHLIKIYTAIFDYIKTNGNEQNKARLTNINNNHPSLEYYIKKRIITDNLHGVDIMEEATEIAKLRLFLSLVACAETVNDLEPLPNVDFNIMAGNSLIGLIRVDGNAFNDLQVEGLAQGNLLNQLAASEYERILTEKNESIKKYKEHAFKAGEIEGTDQDFRLQMLRDHIEQVNRESMVKLNQLLLDEFSQKLGIKYEEKQLKGKAKKRLLNIQDIEALKPFHWGYHFDEIISKGGFDIILGNPPWEIFKPQAKEFFAQYSNLVTKNKMDIKTFQKQQKKLLENPEIAEAWLEYQSQYPHVSLYFRNAEQYRNQISVVNGRKQGSDINLYKLFIEQCVNLLNENGRCGIIIPTGIYTDLGTKQLRKLLFSQTCLGKLFSLSNERFIFEGVDHRFKFCLLDFEKGNNTQSFKATFRIDPREAIKTEDLDRFLHDEAELITIDVDIIRKLSPDSISVMEFKSDLDIVIVKKMSQFPLLGEKIEGKWNLKLTAEFHMTNDSHLFKTELAKGRLPLYEGKMIHQFTHNFAQPRYWIDEAEGRQKILGKKGVDNGQTLDYQCYRLGFRSVASSTNERALISSILPSSVFCGNSLLVSIINLDNNKVTFSYSEILFSVALFNSFVVDFILRKKVSQNLNMFYVYQLPVPRLTEGDTYFKGIVERSGKLICTTSEYDDLAKEVGLIPLNPPFKGANSDSVYGVTDEQERMKIRAEIDGMVAHLYGLTETEFKHILSTFPIVSEEIKEKTLEAYQDVEKGLIP